MNTKETKNKKHYAIIVTDNKLTTIETLCRNFDKMPEEIRWDYCDCAEEYICRGEVEGELIVLDNEDSIVVKSPLTPNQYGRQFLGIKIPNDITIEEFDILVADKYNLWNYPLNEFNETIENDSNVVIVKFDKESTYRFVEVA